MYSEGVQVIHRINNIELDMRQCKQDYSNTPTFEYFNKIT